MIYIIVTIWMIAIIWGLWVLAKGSKQLKDDNNGIYQDEHESRLDVRYDYDDDCFHESHTL